jgi:uncharacterized protein YjbI with pentapeptide repeats
MANEEQLSILKQGVEVWNKWRDENPYIEIDLRQANLQKDEFNQGDFQGAQLKSADLYEAKLSGANLFGANLQGASLTRADLYKGNFRRCNFMTAHLQETNLRSAYFHRANFNGAVLTDADLSFAELDNTDLSGAEFWDANLSGVSLRQTDFTGAFLARANLTSAELWKTNFRQTDLRETNFLYAVMSGTMFGNLDLSEAIGLDDIVHRGPSTIGMDVVARSKGKIPEAFLRGCGLNDWEIEETKLYNPDLSNEEINKILYRIYDLRATQALQISPLFISYSHADGPFVDKLEGQLNEKGVRFWRDIHEMKAGRVEIQIDRAIRQNPTVLLVLSEHSLMSDWVEHEVRAARGLEKELGRAVLCPVALDNSWKNSRWPKRIMEQIMEYNILDFSAWKDDSKFDGLFRKLIDGLELFYKG